MESFFHVDNEDSEQTAWLHRLNRVFIGYTCQKVGVLKLRLIRYNNIFIIQVNMLFSTKVH